MKLKLKVMVIDDDFSSRRLIERVIRKNFGFEVTHAEEGSGGLRSMLKNPPDLLILDMMMPFMNGLQVLRTMQENAVLSEVPVIACSGVGDNKVVREAIKYGIRHYVVKPIVKEVLIDKIAEVTGSMNKEKTNG